MVTSVETLAVWKLWATFCVRLLSVVLLIFLGDLLLLSFLNVLVKCQLEVIFLKTAPACQLSGQPCCLLSCLPSWDALACDGPG